jgi:hypothetical protein
MSTEVKKPHKQTPNQPVVFDNWTFVQLKGGQIKFKAQRGADLMSALTYEGRHADAMDYKSVWVDANTRNVVNSFTNDLVGELKR